MRTLTRGLLPIGTLVLLAATAVSLGSISGATPDHGDIQRTELGRGVHTADGEMAFRSGEETVVFTVTMAPGADSGWHRHPGAVVVVVTSGTLTTYGLSAEPCVGKDISAGEVYFEADAAEAPYPHFVRNGGDEPVELVVAAYNVPAGGSPRTDADAPARCPDPA